MATPKTAAKSSVKDDATATEATKPTAVIETLKTSYENVTGNFKGYGENLNQAGSVANETLRSTFNGVMAFDRALLNMLRANVDSWVEHGRNIAQAPSLVAVAEQHKDFVIKQVETVSAQIKDLSDVAEEQSKTSMAPLFSAVDDMVAAAKTKKDEKAA